MNITLKEPLAIHELGQRKNQEDSLYPALGSATLDSRLFVVCDGMGGHEKGEVASATVCRAFSDYIAGRADFSDVIDDNLLHNALDYAYTQLDAADDGAYKKMGTTLTLVLFHKGGVTMTHIGDSRIYHIRPGIPRLLYVSRDHSLVFDLYAAGELAYGEMKTDRRKNIVTRALMPGEDVRTTLAIAHTTDVQPGDYFYLCSDGMLENMDDGELTDILCGTGSNEDKAHELVRRTADNRDNHTAYLIQVAAVRREEGDNQLRHDEHTTRCNALNIRPHSNEDENHNAYNGNANEGFVTPPKQAAPTPSPTQTQPARRHSTRVSDLGAQISLRWLAAGLVLAIFGLALAFILYLLRA
ncbi:MAG: serine/threonine-protein phosphatase [Bacteroidaceae bacterium]|nr:serine/threonine-protein phosphatase [Bacteroidaceae bacterium]